jgi:RNA polymerase sigma-70 factor (ECF subfamily)
VLDLDRHLPEIVAGDPDAFARWVAGGAEHALRDSLRSFAASVDTEAVVQEALLRVWQVARLLVPDGNPNALLRFAVTVARRLALSEARRRHPGAELPPDLPVAPVEPDPRLRELIRTCLALLPPQPRLAMLARIAARGGEDDRSLARRVQMKLNTFLQNVTRARRLVAECLKSKGVDAEASS